MKSYQALFIIGCCLISLNACQEQTNRQEAQGQTVLDSLGKWTKIMDFSNPPIELMASFRIGSKGYLVGGWDGSKALNQTLEFDPVFNQWKALSSIPNKGVYQTTTVVCMGKAFLIGGSSNEGLFGNHVWEYQPQKDKWVQKKDFPGKSRYAAASFCANNSIYYGTGITINDEQEVVLNDWWVFHPEKNSWQQLKDIPNGGLSFAVAMNINEQGYLGIGTEQTSASIWMVYDDLKDQWTFKKPFPGIVGKQQASLVILKKGYVQMGNSNKCWEYNPLTDNWLPLKAAPFIKSGAGAFSIGYKGYFIGGSANATLQKDVWEFSAE